MKTAVFLFGLVMMLCFLRNPDPLYGQESDVLSSLEDLENPEEADDAEWLEKLWELRENPLNLNSASLGELLQLPFLDIITARKILKYRDTRDFFSNIRDLLAIEGLSEEIVHAIQPFVTAKPVSLPGSFIYRIQVRTEIPRRLGYRSQIYRNPFYIQQRLLFQTRYNISGGIIWEKDAGEPDYFDYGSFYLHYHPPGKRFSIIAGDYYQKIGTGLISWSPYGSPLSIQGPNPFHSGGQGNRSTRESGFFRGISLNYSPIPGLNIRFFYSRNQLDASRDKITGEVTSLYLTGLHRTSGEQEKRRYVTENVTGFTTELDYSFINFELAHLYFRYEPVVKFLGSGISYTSIINRFTGANLNAISELALKDLKIPAFFHCSSYRDNQANWNFIAYYFHPHYSTFHGKTIGGFQAEPSNKSGTAAVWQYRPVKGFMVGAVAHFYRENKSPDSNPFTAQNYTAEIVLKRWKNVIKLQWRRTYRPLSGEQEYKKSDGLRISHETEIEKMIRLVNRVDLRWINPLVTESGFYGMSFYQQLELSKPSWSAAVRWSVFDIPDYEMRIYEFETDLPGSIRSVLLNGNGYKLFLILRLKFGRSVQMDFKYQQRYYPDETTIGSGADSFPKPRIHELRFSIICRR